MVSLTPRPVYTRGKSPRYPLDRRLGGPQNRSALYGEENNILPCREWNPDRLAHSLSAKLIQLPRLPMNVQVSSFINF
jgi:hypothetical protein